MQQLQEFSHEDLRQLELTGFIKEFLGTIKLFCCIAWSHSPRSVKNLYPRYELLKPELKKRQETHRLLVEDNEALSMDQLLCNYLDPMVQIFNYYDPEWGCPTDSAIVLRLASYVGCLFGAEASYGDVRYECDILQDCCKRRSKRFRSIEAAVAAYRSGDAFPLVLYLNTLIAQSSLELTSLELHPGTRVCVHHAPSAWHWIESTNFPTVDTQVINTKYHLYVSLSQFVEQGACTVA